MKMSKENYLDDYSEQLSETDSLLSILKQENEDSLENSYTNSGESSISDSISLELASTTPIVIASNTKRIVARKPGYPIPRKPIYTSHQINLMDKMARIRINRCKNIERKLPKTKSSQQQSDPQPKATTRKLAVSKQNGENIYAIRSKIMALAENQELFSNLESLQNLGPWEQWILKKETERRKNLMKKRSKQVLNELEMEKRQIDESIKKQQRKLAWAEWLKKVADREEAERERIEEQQKHKSEAQQLRESHRELKSRGPHSFSAWLKRKHEREQAQKEEIELKNRESLNQKREKAKNAEQAFKAWKLRHALTSERNFYTEGLTQDGCIIKFYDRTANPIPEFNNPIDWT